MAKSDLRSALVNVASLTGLKKPLQPQPSAKALSTGIQSILVHIGAIGRNCKGKRYNIECVPSMKQGTQHLLNLPDLPSQVCTSFLLFVHAGVT